MTHQDNEKMHFEEERDIAAEVRELQEGLGLPEPNDGTVISDYEGLFSYYKNCILFHAIEKFVRAELIEEVFIQEGANPNAQDGNGETPLMYVFRNPSKDMDKKVRILLNAGADIELKNDEELTVVHIAIFNEAEDSEPYNKAFQALMSCNPQVYDFMLRDAILENNLIAAKCLISSPDINIQYRDSNGMSLLDYTISMDTKDMVDLLIENGAK